MSEQPEYFDIDDDDDCCSECHGAGGFHDCGEDSCCCLDNEGGPDDMDWFVCGTCGGEGVV